MHNTLSPAEIAAQAAAGPVLPPATTKKKSLVLPIILMVWPGVALVLSIFLYAIFNFATAASTPSTDDAADLFGDTAESPLRTLVNVSMYLVGAASILFGLPSFIAGVVILIKRLKK